mgnify:CR=1 FL=1
MKISVRNQKKNIREPFAKAIEGLRGYGGGHEKACGGNINKEDFEEFIKRLGKFVK